MTHQSRVTVLRMRTLCGGWGSGLLMMAASEKTNDDYEWEFVEPPPIEFDCPECHNVLREPNLTTCCGSHFCQTCIEPIAREGKPCPNPECNERGFTAFLDKSVQRKIFGLDVKCPMWRKGCNWNGELAKRDGHLDGKNGDCQFVDVDCSKGCGGRVQRRELPEHLERDCPMRHYVCDYCNFEATYEVVITQHWPVCENFPLSCPNECGVEKVERRHFEQHLSECPLQVVECDFSYAGCTAKVRRQDLQQHMEESTQNHMKMLSHFTLQLIKQLHAVVADLRQKKDQQIADLRQEKDQQIADLQEKLLSEVQQSLEANIDFCHTFQFSLPKFSDHKVRKSEHWYSPDFYTSDGYKMQISVVADSATGDGVISVYAYIKRGRFDRQLAWPLKATVILQLNDPTGSHRPYERSLEGEWKRTTFLDRRNSCKWDPFITHAELEKYLKDDTLHFQVVSVALK